MKRGREIIRKAGLEETEVNTNRNEKNIIIIIIILIIIIIIIKMGGLVVARVARMD